VLRRSSRVRERAVVRPHAKACGYRILGVADIACVEQRTYGRDGALAHRAGARLD